MDHDVAITAAGNSRPVSPGPVSSRATRVLRKVAGEVGMQVLLIAGAIVMVAPFLWMALSGVKTLSEIFRNPPTLVPHVWQWHNIVESLTILPFDHAYFNSLYISVSIVVGQLITCSMAGFAFGKLDFRMKTPLFYVFLATLMVPPQVTIVPLYLIMKGFGWIDTSLSLIVPGVLFNAFGVFLLRQFFLSAPDELFDAAILDGASPWTVYSRVMLPLVKPALSALGIVAFLQSWNGFFYPLVFFNTPTRFTVPILLSLFKGEYTTNWPDVMAACSIAVLPVLIVYLFAQRYIIEGVALTGMKS